MTDPHLQPLAEWAPPRADVDVGTPLQLMGYSSSSSAAQRSSIAMAPAWTRVNGS